VTESQWLHPSGSDWLRWQGGTIPEMARRIHDERAWSLMPVLADMLEDAGCTDADVLWHLRGKRRCGSCGGSGVRRAVVIDGDPTPLMCPHVCPDCQGTGHVPAGPACGRCGGRGKEYEESLHFVPDPQVSTTAGSFVRRARDCPDCHGTGRLAPVFCRGDWVLDLLLGKE